MLKLLIPLVLALLGLGAGVGAGLALKAPAKDTKAADCALPADAGHAAGPPETKLGTPKPLERDYVKLNNQFVVPVVHDGKIRALVVMSLSLEVTKGQGEAVYPREPKLRDAFLRVMFDHANAGGFDGDFTANGNMLPLREGLLNAARQILGDAVTDVLIIEIVRQDN